MLEALKRIEARQARGVEEAGRPASDDADGRPWTESRVDPPSPAADEELVPETVPFFEHHGPPAPQDVADQEENTPPGPATAVLPGEPADDAAPAARDTSQEPEGRDTIPWRKKDTSEPGPRETPFGEPLAREAPVPPSRVPREAHAAPPAADAAAPPHDPGPPADFQGEISELVARRAGGRDPGFCQMAANILAQLPAGRSAVLLFTSPAGERTTTRTVAPLAAILGETVRGGVLAVDARSADAELAASFGVSARRGFREVLEGAARWQDVVRATPISNLHVLPGSEGTGAAQSPLSGVLAAMLDQARRQYRLVLIDADSLDRPEAGALARLCDGVYLVVRLGRTPRRAVLEAMDAARRSGGRVLGCIAAGD